MALYISFYVLCILLMIISNCHSKVNITTVKVSITSVKISTELTNIKTTNISTSPKSTLNDTKVNLHVFYSPTDIHCYRFINEMLFEVAMSEVGLYIDLKMFPVVMCELVSNDTVGRKYTKAKTPLSCTAGKDEEILAVEHLCAYETLSQGGKSEYSSEQQQIDKIRMIEGIEYILCMYKEKENEINKTIKRCRYDLPGKRGKTIKDCVEKKAEKYCEEAVKLYKKFDPFYFPFLVINGKQSKKQDVAALSNLGNVLCKELNNKPGRCKKPFDLEEVEFPVYSNEPGYVPSSSKSCSFQPHFLTMVIIVLFC